MTEEQERFVKLAAETGYVLMANDMFQRLRSAIPMMAHLVAGDHERIEVSVVDDLESGGMVACKKCVCGWDRKFLDLPVGRLFVCKKCGGSKKRWNNAFFYNGTLS